MTVNWLIVSVFALSAVACFAAMLRGTPLKKRDARLGLQALLATVGVWGLLQALQMATRSETLASGLFTAALIVGFGTVWAWLYFCSAYAGLGYHNDIRVQAIGLVTYGVFSIIKVTNPIHGQYFRGELVTDPYIRLLVDQQPIYWISFALAYVLTGVGFYILYQFFRRSDRSATTLGILVGITGLSIIPKAISAGYPELLPELSYEPIGVAVFALGVVYIVEDTFLDLEAPTRQQMLEESDEAIVTIADDGRVHDYNERALEFLPGLNGSIGNEKDLEAALSIEIPRDQSTVVTLEQAGEQRYLLVTRRTLSIGPHELGYAVLIQDVTTSERRRQELERHNEQLEEMAGAIAHELRNSVAIIEGYLNEASERIESGKQKDAREAVKVASETTNRMERVIDQLHSLTKYAQSIDKHMKIELRPVVEEAHRTVNPEFNVKLEREGTIHGAPKRIQDLFVNAFEFAKYNEATSVTVALQDETLTITDDGKYTSSEYGDLLVEYEASAPTPDAGMLLPNVKTLARVHGWSLEIDEEYDQGVQYHITGIDTNLTDRTYTPPENIR